MPRPRIPPRLHGVPAAAAGLTVAAGLVLALLVSLFAADVFGPVGSASAGMRTATARVVTSRSCTAPEAHDVVSVTVGGRRHTAELSGCGHRVGKRVRILLPQAFTPATVLAPARTDTAERHYGSRIVAGVLLALAGVGGGFVALRARGTGPSHRRRVEAPEMDGRAAA